MIRYVVATVAMLGMGSGVLEAQQPNDASRRIEAAQLRVAQAGLPAELLVAKIAEGRAKGVSEERIAMVAERRAAGLLKAQEALAGTGRRMGSSELAAGADAVEAGVDGASLRAAIQQARDENTAVALAVLGHLVKQGLPVEQALHRVESALQQGGGALASLPQQAAEARERRGAPAAGRPVGAGRPSGVGNAPAGAPAGKPSGLPAAGSRPGTGTPGGKPSGVPGGRP